MLFFIFLYVIFYVIYVISQNTQENTCGGVLFLTKMMAVKRTSANGWFWFLEIYFYNSKRFSRTENHAHAIRCIWPKFVKVHSLNFSYDHKDYANFDNAFSTITKIFPGPILNGKLIAHYRTVTNLKTLIGRRTS